MLKYVKRMLKNVKGKMANWVLRAFPTHGHLVDTWLN